MKGGKQNVCVSQPTSMENVPNRPVLAIRVFKVSRPNRHHSFPSFTRPTQIKSTNSIHIPITLNDYSSSIPPAPCNTPTYSQIDINASRKSYGHFWNNDDFQANSRSPNEIYNNLEKNSQRFPVMKKYFIVRKRQVDKNEVADDGHSPNLPKSPEIVVEDPTLNTQLSKINSPDTDYQSVDDDLKNNSTKKRICHCISTEMCVILCIFVFLLISGAIFGTILGILFTRNLL